MAESTVSIAFGSSTLELELKTDEKSGLYAWHKYAAPPLQGLSSKFERFEGFGRGCGAFLNEGGRYSIGLNFDGSFDLGMPGPREEADLTGIAAGYRVKRLIVHNGVNWALTYNGTNTRVYRVETGAWAQKREVASVEGTDLVSFKGVVAVALGASTAFQYSSNDGTAWTSSTKTGNADNANFFLVQMNGLLAPRVTYVRNPNEVYFTEALDNTADPTGSVSSKIGDNTAYNYFTSLAEDDIGTVLFGMRRALFSMNSEGEVFKLTEDFDDPVADAGGQSDRKNFECVVSLDGRLYYNVEGYDILEYYRGQVNKYMHPRHIGTQVPRMHLPVNAMCRAGNWMIVALGSKNTATLKGVAHAPSGTARLGNSFGTTSELYKMRYEEVGGQVVWVCHGIILQCTDPLRYMWYDEATNMLYMASGDSESADLQMTRAYLVQDNPLYHLTSSAVKLNNGTWQVEMGRVDYGDPQLVKEMRKIEVFAIGLSSSVPSLEVEYKKTSDYDATAFKTDFVTYVSNATAETGTSFDAGETFRTAWFRFVGIGTGNTYAIMQGAVLTCEDHPTKYDRIDITAYATSGKTRSTGVRSSMSGKGITDLLDTWKSTKAVATLTDKVSGDTYSVKLAGYSLRGLGAKQEMSLQLIEAA